MKQKLLLLLLAACILVFPMLWGCGGAGESLSELIQERDSLHYALEERDNQIDQMSNFFDSLSVYIDSISMQEQLMFVSVDPETNRQLSPAEIRQRLEDLANTIARQREKIRELTDKLNSTADPQKYAGLSNMVTYLSGQLEQKELTIKQLKAEISSKNRSLNELNISYQSAQAKLNEAKSRNETLSAAVVAQSDAMNEGYILVGSKHQLQAAGALSKGGFLKKSSFNAGGINLSLCQRVDIRHLRQLPLQSKNPKILTGAPNGSYHIVDNGNNTKTLVIDNPTAFWSLSNILVIQL